MPAEKRPNPGYSPHHALDLFDWFWPQKGADNKAFWKWVDTPEAEPYLRAMADMRKPISPDDYGAFFLTTDEVARALNRANEDGPVDLTDLDIDDLQEPRIRDAFVASIEARFSEPKPSDSPATD